MSSQVADMPSHINKECHFVIHTAAAAAGAAGAIPLPIADALPIGTAQIGMIIGLGKVFDITVSRALAEEIAGIGLAVMGGRFIASNLAKLVPGLGSVVGAATALAITEAMGWIVADDFYRISVGRKPEKLFKAADAIKSCFSKISKGARR